MSNQAAVRQFTDRTEPQLAFASAYLDLASRMPGENNSRILTYYGIGGIGKSTLLGKLAENLITAPELTEKNKGKPLFAEFNFETKQEDVQVLSRLKNILNTKYNWHFPHFEVGLYLYLRKIGEDAEEPEAKTVMDQQPIIKLAVDIASEVPIVGPFVGAVFKWISYVDQGQAALRTLLKQHSDLVTQFEKLPAAKLREALPGLFATDLNSYTQKSATPLVVFLDTYECIERSTLHGSTLRTDLWIHGANRLIESSKNTIWVIAGRDQIRWNVPGCTKEDHLLGALSEVDACSFLAAAGIPEHLQEPMYKLTEGLPIYLDVCVDHYEQLLRQGETPDISKFGNDDSERLLDCYIRYMDKSVKEMVYMLTFLPKWNEALVRSAAPKVLGSFILADYKRVKKLSITTQMDADHYFIHHTVAEILRNAPENDRRESTAQFMIEHYSKVLEEKSPYEDAYADALDTVMYAGLLLYRDRDAFAEFSMKVIEGAMNALLSCRRYDRVKEIFAPYWRRAEENKEDFLYGIALCNRAWYAYKCRENADELFEWAIESVRILRKNKGDSDGSVLWALGAVSIYLAEFYRRYAESAAVYRYMLEQYQQHHPDNHGAILNTMRNLAHNYRRASNKCDADILYEELLAKYRAQFGNTDSRTLRAMRDLAVSCYDQGDYERAKALEEEALALSREVLGEEHPDTITTMSRLATTYYRLGAHEQEMALREKVLTMRRKLQGLHHADTQSVLRSNVLRYSQLKQDHKLIALHKEVMECFQRAEGKALTEWMNSVGYLADAYSRQENFQAEIPLRLEILNSHRKNRTLNQHKGRRAVEDLAKAYRNGGQHQLEADLWGEQLDNYRMREGKDDPYLLVKIACCYRAMEEYDRAQALLQTAIDRAVNLWGQDDTRTLEFMETLAIGIAREMGDLEQAKQLLLQAERIQLKTFQGECYNTERNVWYLMDCYIRAGRSQEALDFLEEVTAEGLIGQMSFEGRTRKAQLLRELGREEEANAMWMPREQPVEAPAQGTLAAMIEDVRRRETASKKPEEAKPQPISLTYEGLSLDEVLDKIRQTREEYQQACKSFEVPGAQKSVQQMSLKELMDMVRQQQEQKGT